MILRNEGVALVKENRSLRTLALLGVGLLAPLFTLGFAVGRLTAPVVVAETAPVQPEPAHATPVKRSKPAKAKTPAVPVTPVSQDVSQDAN